jgi:hypothetical protein
VDASDEAALRAEALYLGAFLFDHVSGAVADHYVRAHAEVFSDGESRAVDVRRIVERGLDAEAIELALRLRDPKNALTQKMQILVYLAEARREYYDAFVLERATPLRAFLRLAVGTLRSLCKWAKGRWLVGRHDVA